MKQHSRAAMLAALSILLPIACGSLPRPAGAQDCVTPESIAAEVRRDSPEAEVRPISGAQAARVSAGISHLIGQEVPEGGSYLVAHAPAALLTYVVRFVDGCATHHGRFPDRLVRLWLDGSPA
ncbi:MAG: hypothetical protein ACREEP_14815 [Dongiaceae bacterium]